MARILGLDLGLKRFGYAVLENKKVVTKGIIRPRGKELAEKLVSIAEDLQEILENYRPDYVVFEKVLYFRSIKSALMLGAVKGVVLYILKKYDTPVYELSPTRIKNAVTGNGSASKEKVAFMVKAILKITEDLPYDISDALAGAIALEKDLEIEDVLRN